MGSALSDELAIAEVVDPENSQLPSCYEVLAVIADTNTHEFI